MQKDDNLRSYYYKYNKKDNNVKSHAVSSGWGYLFFLAGLGLGILFFAFILQYGFNNIVLSLIGIFSLLLVTAGLIILINNN